MFNSKSSALTISILGYIYFFLFSREQFFAANQLNNSLNAFFFLNVYLILEEFIVITNYKHQNLK